MTDTERLRELVEQFLRLTVTPNDIAIRYTAYRARRALRELDAAAALAADRRRPMTPFIWRIIESESAGVDETESDIEDALARGGAR